MNETAKFSLEEARQVARRLTALLSDHVERIQIVGSIRRQKPLVKDIELLYIPKFERAPDEQLFEERLENVTDRKLDALLAAGFLAKRVNRKGRFAWGDKNKLAQHVESGIPVDFFATTAGAWANYLVCRTGGMESNIRICQAAIARGWHWDPYGEGFSSPALHEGETRVHVIGSEREVFEFVGLTYKEPKER